MLLCQGRVPLLGGLQYRGAESRLSHPIGRLQKSYSIFQPLKVSRRAASVACRAGTFTGLSAANDSLVGATLSRTEPELYTHSCAGYTPFPFNKDDYIK